MLSTLKKSWLGIIRNSFLSAYEAVKADIKTKKRNKKKYYNIY
tara:strand:+ start:2327 stop:2455 length:129 start_codon:yes stop_codon:yes gene_type:complete